MYTDTGSRGVASASVRCLAIAGEHLSVRREQEEVIEIFERIKKETGWRIMVIIDDLKEKWGWNQSSPHDSTGTGSTSISSYDVNGNALPSSSCFFESVGGGAAGGAGGNTMPPPPPNQVRNRFPPGIVNPLYKNSDFLGPNPPYQGNYVAPNHSTAGLGIGLLQHQQGVIGQGQQQQQHYAPAGSMGQMQQQQQQQQPQHYAQAPQHQYAYPGLSAGM